MSDDSEFRIRPGRIRSTRAQQARPFVAQALAAAQKAGGRVSRSGRPLAGPRGLPNGFLPGGFPPPDLKGRPPCRLSFSVIGA